MEACRGEPDVQAFLHYLDGSKRKVRRAALDLACAMTRLLPLAAETRTLCEGSREDLILFLLHQLYSNLGEKLGDEPSGDLLFRGHHQLPCTRSTLQRRVREVQRHIRLDEPILIIGDDDMQSVALAEAGHTDITVVEIDAAIADTIKRASEGSRTPIRIVREDITKVDGALARPFRVTLIDPPCHLPGFMAFLDGAGRLNTAQKERFLFLNTNLLSYGRDGYQQVSAALARQRLSPSQFWLGFNRYALPRLPRLALSLLLHGFEPRSPVTLRVFASDLMIMTGNDGSVARPLPIACP